MRRKVKNTLKIIWIIFGWFAGVALIASLCAMKNSELITKYILPTVFTMLMIVLIITGLSIIMSVLGERFGKKEYQKEKFSPIDKKKEEYYREILKDNTPLILELVDSYDISINGVIAELLYLKQKNVIDFQNDQIIVLKNETLELNEIDKFIIKSINSNGKYELYQESLLNIVSKTAEKSQLILRVLYGENNIEKVKRKAGVFALSIFVIIICLICLLLNVPFIETLDAMTMPATVIAIFFYLAYVSKYEKLNKSVPYIRSKNGEKLNKKLEGLKMYLKDYSLLSEKDANAIELWEDYLLYSVIFGQNKSVVNEYFKYIDEKN